MPICKNCKTRIERFNKDRCPFCGVEKPFEGMSSDTVEITTNIDVGDINVDYHPRKKKTLFILFVTLGIFGVPFFYLHKALVGVLYGLLNLALIAGCSFLLYYFTPASLWISIILFVVVMTLINSLVGLIFNGKSNLKDGRGEFVI